MGGRYVDRRYDEFRQPALNGADENLRVIERFKKKGWITSHSFRVEDPTVWTSAWEGDFPWPRTDAKVYEYACHEGNYALGNIMRGARLLEQDAEAASSAGGD